MTNQEIAEVLRYVEGIMKGEVESNYEDPTNPLENVVDWFTIEKDMYTIDEIIALIPHHIRFTQDDFKIFMNGICI